MEVDKKSKRKIDEFFKRNKENLKNPIIKSFLSDSKNYKLLLNYLLNTTDNNKKAVDNAFQLHYINVKKIKYISNLIYYFSVDFDKKKRRDVNRNLLVLDKRLPNDTTSTYKDLIEDKSRNIVNVFGASLFDHIEDKKLVKALNYLTQKQLKIVEMIYLKNLSLKEIAKLLQSTPQNISNQHRKALKKLYKNYNGVEQ
ncbi:sigma-70 family RNA polymerase sigma factor [Virgibacillus sp. AGTR]|uniref:sigma factor-like helix-turn-helix DNA-binding protein n=1 Tax=Virgibacillus sp. AGTR TaxID=2812055 RepID=UPI001D16AF84|nr:sigma-70 family RNA polymerase sigma factor [Virgibacillus sp. AGTR]MCC2248968.1 sigma-70 family RNA polymerase sigma factor [Virgibacillus sp. AGTR]